MNAQLNAQMSAQLDLNELVTMATDIAELIKNSEETQRFLTSKSNLYLDPHASSLIAEFSSKKQAFADCERYGHFHPDYHRTFDDVVEVQDRLNNLEVMKQFREAEKRLDELLFDVSKLIAASVSDSILVPNNLENDAPKGGCGDGGCSGKCS